MKITGYVEIKQFKDFVNKLPVRLKAEMRRTLREGAELLAFHTRLNAPIDTGNLYRHIKVTPGQYGRGRTMNDLVYEVHVDVQYASFVEYGTRRGTPRYWYLHRAMRECAPEIKQMVRESFQRALGRTNSKLIAENFHTIGGFLT